MTEINVKTESFTFDPIAKAWRPEIQFRRNVTRVLLLLMALGAAIAAMLLAEPGEAQADPQGTINLTEVQTVDGVDYPVCAEEDCSDQPGQIGIWTNAEGNSYLELGEGVTLLIVDDTVVR